MLVENFSREREIIRGKWQWEKFLKMNVLEMKNFFVRLIIKFDTVKKRISECEDTSTGNFP